MTFIFIFFNILLIYLTYLVPHFGTYLAAYLKNVLTLVYYFPLGHKAPYLSIPVDGPKVTSAIWGPLDYYIIAGHENGTVCQWDAKVSLRNLDVPGNSSIAKIKLTGLDLERSVGCTKIMTLKSQKVQQQKNVFCKGHFLTTGF